MRYYRRKTSRHSNRMLREQSKILDPYRTWLLKTAGNFTVPYGRESASVPPPHSVAPTRLNTSIVAADLFLIREAVVGGSTGQVHLSQAASLPVLLPPPRERSTAVTGKLHCTVQKKKRGGGGLERSGGAEQLASPPLSLPSSPPLRCPPVRG